MSWYDEVSKECQACLGTGKLTDEYTEEWEWCHACDGTGSIETELDSDDEE